MLSPENRKQAAARTLTPILRDAARDLGIQPGSDKINDLGRAIARAYDAGHEAARAEDLIAALDDVATEETRRARELERALDNLDT